MNKITLTEQAAEQVRKFMTEDGTQAGLRLGLRQVGCSGYMYQVEVTDQIKPSDEIFESRGVRIIVSKEQLPHLIGTEVDFRQKDLKEAFHFTNPNAAASCGCGESFSIVSDQAPTPKVVT